MKKSKFSETEIVSILKQGDAGVAVKDLCRQAGISTATYYQWKLKYGGMEASDLKRVKELESENARLKRLYAELALARLVEDKPTRGFGQCCQLLERTHPQWNPKRIYRVYCAMTLNLRRAAERRLRHCGHRPPNPAALASQRGPRGRRWPA
jgi:putative transposase